jgi:organic hydroperoxide reductase OsmC/OhrA
MHPYPHLYSVTARGEPAGEVPVETAGVPELPTQPPPQFDGPEGFWSPETLLTASLADCFILTFRAVARLSKLPWLRLECRVEGTLDRVDGVAQFSAFRTIATLTVPAGTDAAKAQQLLQKAEHSCLIANSLKARRDLEARVLESAAA